MVLPNPTNVVGIMSVTLASGAGVPTHGAPKGSLYTNTLGAANTRLYINSDGGTSWAAVTSA